MKTRLGSHLSRLLEQEKVMLPKDMMFGLVFSGLANTVMLAIINKSAKAVDEGSSNDINMLLFIVAAVVHIFCLQTALRTIGEVFETTFHQIRIRIVDKLCGAQLQNQESIGAALVYKCLGEDLRTLSESKRNLANAAQSVIMLVFAAFYMFFLSPMGFLATVVLMILGSLMFLSHDKTSSEMLELASAKVLEMMEGVGHILDGFVEMRMSRKRNVALFEEMVTTSAELKDSEIGRDRLESFLLVMTQCYFYLIIACVVFVLPRLVSAHSESITQLTASILFLTGPLSALIGAISRLSRVDRAAQSILELEAMLSSARILDTEPLPTGYQSFKRILFENVTFAYTDADGERLFQVGPLNFHVNQGEILFIVGGNGSGKSTIMKLLTSLYFPESGRLMLDKQPISNKNCQEYRELFSIIFGDFHLFKKLYGIENINEQKVLELLQLLGLEGKTRFLKDHFTRLDLSSGQKKRLALLITYLEARPICVFDEWAADQDPEFREYFYETLLPMWKKQGKTIIAVSHDDRYFHVADRILKLDYGNIVNKGIDGPARPEG